MSGLRQHTVFEPCEFHESWYASETRRRRAEVMVEGGWGGSPCPGRKCRMKPGTDFFEAGFVRDNPVYEVGSCGPADPGEPRCQTCAPSGSPGTEMR
jgi:hypothetical protein